jgi:membrane-associated phospholipid phosphatase
MSSGLNNETESNLNCKERIGFALKTFFPFIVLYLLRIRLGALTYPVNIYFDFEHHIPVIEWTNIFHLSAYVMVACFPFINGNRVLAKSFLRDGNLGVLFGMFLMYFSPFVCPPREFLPETILGDTILFERQLDSIHTAFPSFHVIWSVIVGQYYVKKFVKYRIVIITWVLLIIGSTITTGVHSILDVLVGIIIAFLIVKFKKVDKVHMVEKSPII